MKSVAEKIAEVLKVMEEMGEEARHFAGGIQVGNQSWDIWNFFAANQLIEFASILKDLKISLPYEEPSYGIVQEKFIDLFNERTQLERWLKLQAFK